MMFTLERLFHLDLHCKWNSSSARYEELTDEQYKKLYEPIVHKAKEDIKGLVRPLCLFHSHESDRDDEILAKMHKNSKLWLIVIRNTEHRLGASHVGHAITSQELLTPQAMIRIRSELPLCLSNGLPLLAEVKIALG